MASSSKIRLRLTLAICLLSAVASAQPPPDPFLSGDISMARSQLEAHVPKYPAAELTRLAELLGRSNNVARAVQQAVIQDDFTNTAALLVQFPGTPDDIDFAGEPLLLNQATRDKPEIMKLLLDHKADPNRANSSGDTALLRAIQNGHFDAALMLRVYHEVAHPPLLLASLLVSMKPGARLAVIDHPRHGDDHGINPDIVIAEVQRSGFHFVKQYDFTKADQNDYLLLFTKP